MIDEKQPEEMGRATLVLVWIISKMKNLSFIKCSTYISIEHILLLLLSLYTIFFVVYIKLMFSSDLLLPNTCTHDNN